MVEAIPQNNIGEQPRSLSINWMKYDVTDENMENLQVPSRHDETPVKLSPLRQRLQERAERMQQKRVLRTREEIESRVEEARMRRDIASVEAVIKREQPKARRAKCQANHQAYLSQMARKRQEHEEAIVLEAQHNIRRIRDR